MFKTYRVSGVEGVPDYEVRKYSDKQNKTLLIIPVLNEGQRIKQQLEEMNKEAFSVDLIIADGGSADGLREFIETKKLNVVAFLEKHGDGQLSSQLRMGFHYSLSEGYESVITMDGNKKDDSAGVRNILDSLNKGIDFVQGSRFIKGGEAVNTPLLRYFAIRLIHAPLTSLGARYWFTDTTNGFRGFSKKFISHAEVDIFREIFKSYELLAYLPIRAKQIGMKVCEVPVARRYPRGVKTPTKIHGFSSQLNLLKILLRAVRGKYAPKKSES